MSIISRYEVRLKCIELATSMSSSQEPLDDIFSKADRIYKWINNIGSGNKKHNTKPGRQNRQSRGRRDQYKQQSDYSDDADFNYTQDDLFD